MLKIENLSFSYNKNSPKILDNLNLDLPAGNIGVLLGKNGSGKTTLFKNILGLCKNQSGTISFENEDLTKMNNRKRAKIVGYVPQKIDFGELSVFDSILLGRISYYNLRASKDDYLEVEKVIEELGLNEIAYKNATKISGGEKQKVAIARALVQNPKMIIFDEPTGNLDIENEYLIIEQAKKISREKGITVFSSLHDLNEAVLFGDKFFFIKDGKIKYSGDKTVINEQIIQDIYGLKTKIFEIENRTIIIGGLKW